MKTATVLQAGLLSSALMLAFSVSVAKAETTDWRKGAAGREVDCELQVKGKTYLKGTGMHNANCQVPQRLLMSVGYFRTGRNSPPVVGAAMPKPTSAFD